MAAYVEDRIVLGGFASEGGELDGVFPEGFLVVEEVYGLGVVF